MNGPAGPPQPTVPDELLPPPPPPPPKPRGFEETSTYLRAFVEEHVEDGHKKKKEIWRWGLSIGKLILEAALTSSKVIESHIDDSARTIDLKAMIEDLAIARTEFSKRNISEDKTGLGAGIFSEIIDEIERVLREQRTPSS